jgi:hypothetical protein
MTETDAETLLVSLLANSVAALRRQVPLGGKVIDVIVDWASGPNEPPDIETIEVKLRDWRRGAGQAYVSTLHVGRSSVALPSNPRRRIDPGFFEELGVGLIEFDASGWRRVIPPREAPSSVETARLIRGRISGDQP